MPSDLTEKQAIAEMKRRLPWARVREAQSWVSGPRDVFAYSSSGHNWYGASATGRSFRAALRRLLAACRKAGLEVKP